MALHNLARVTSATTGTGTLTLGSAVSGFLTFADAGVSADRLTAIGYADTRPVEPNLLADGRARNRRVTILIESATQEKGTELDLEPAVPATPADSGTGVNAPATDNPGLAVRPVEIQ